MGVVWTTVARTQTEAVLDETLVDDAVRGAVLFGAAGVGKTVLARRATHRFSERHPDAVVHWVTATASARRIPFGAFSHLIDVVSGVDPSAVLAGTRASMCPPGRPVLVVIDDAHLLDEHSATLVHQLATTTSAVVVMTVRVGESGADAVTALWRDDVLARVEVEPLSSGEVTRLVEAVLGDAVAADSAAQMYALCHGNPLFLRHLVEGATQHQTLVKVDRTWQWRGVTVTRRLAEVIDAGLAGLPDPVHRVLEYLAVEEPLPMSVMAMVCGAEAVEAGERAGVVRVLTDGSDLMCHPGHPLYGERLRTAMGQVALRRLRTDLVQRARPARMSRNVSIRLRWMSMAVDSDAPPEAADVLGAAWQAMYLGDFALTELFARAALEMADNVAARIVLAQGLCWQARGRDAEEVLDVVDADELAGYELQYWAISKAINEFWMLRRAEQAAWWLASVRQRIADPAGQLMLDGLGSLFAMNLGDLPRCLELADVVLDDAAAEDLAVGWAASAAAMASGRTGRLERVDALAARCARVTCPDGVRFNAALGQVHAALLTGRADDARTIATHHLTLSQFRQPGHAQGHVLLGYVLLVQGDLRAAQATLATGARFYRDSGINWESVMYTWLATACAQLGEGDAAADAFARAERAHGAHTRIHDPDVAQARAWTHAAAGDQAAAIAAAHDAIASATQSGQLGIAVLAHHDAIRLGDTTACDAIDDLADRVDCALGYAVRAHARGLRDQDGAALDVAASHLEALGVLGGAADAAAHAAHAHDLAGDGARELASRSTAARLRRSCGDPMTPALRAVVAPTPLTNREREIALLVAAGQTNRAIAKHLTLSVRTVEAHVFRACAKLNVPTRTDLALAITANTGRGGPSQS